MYLASKVSMERPSIDADWRRAANVTSSAWPHFLLNLCHGYLPPPRRQVWSTSNGVSECGSIPKRSSCQMTLHKSGEGNTLHLQEDVVMIPRPKGMTFKFQRHIRAYFSVVSENIHTRLELAIVVLRLVYQPINQLILDIPPDFILDLCSLLC